MSLLLLLLTPAPLWGRSRDSCVCYRRGVRGGGGGGCVFQWKCYVWHAAEAPAAAAAPPASTRPYVTAALTPKARQQFGLSIAFQRPRDHLGVA